MTSQYSAAHPIRTVRFDDIITAIDAFNASGANPFGPNMPRPGHAPLTIQIVGVNIDIEFPYHAHQRPEDAHAYLAKHPHFLTRRNVVYASTRAMIQRQWHRFYAFDTSLRIVTGVRLLASPAQDPALFRSHPDCSANAWQRSMLKSPIPVALDGDVEDIIPSSDMSREAAPF